jgi:hypothetical protein
MDALLVVLLLLLVAALAALIAQRRLVRNGWARELDAWNHGVGWGAVHAVLRVAPGGADLNMDQLYDISDAVTEDYASEWGYLTFLNAMDDQGTIVHEYKKAPRSENRGERGASNVRDDGPRGDATAEGSQGAVQPSPPAGTS